MTEPPTADSDADSVLDAPSDSNFALDSSAGGESAAESAASVAEEEEDIIPRLRRGRGIRINPTDLFRIAAVAILLVGIIALQRPCASGVASFVTSVGVDGGLQGYGGDGGPDLGELRKLTDEEIRAAFDGKGADKLLERDADAGLGGIQSDAGFDGGHVGDAGLSVDAGLTP